mmetsp:Transcript_18553/g.38315  ORF Transcript_18553/g.38315 Transcript_18553/m.38315 type:complete len:377 (+) Transcript_18553:517-1647(+)
MLGSCLGRFGSGCLAFLGWRGRVCRDTARVGGAVIRRCGSSRLFGRSSTGSRLALQAMILMRTANFNHLRYLSSSYGSSSRCFFLLTDAGRGAKGGELSLLSCHQASRRAQMSLLLQLQLVLLLLLLLKLQLLRLSLCRHELRTLGLESSQTTWEVLQECHLASLLLLSFTSLEGLQLSMLKSKGVGVLHQELLQGSLILLLLLLLLSLLDSGSSSLESRQQLIFLSLSLDSGSCAREETQTGSCHGIKAASPASRATEASGGGHLLNVRWGRCLQSSRRHGELGLSTTTWKLFRAHDLTFLEGSHCLVEVFFRGLSLPQSRFGRRNQSALLLRGGSERMTRVGKMQVLLIPWGRQQSLTSEKECKSGGVAFQLFQ